MENVATSPKKIYEPFALGIAGPPLVGKSELLKAFGQETNIVPFDIDEIRWRVFPRVSEEYPDGRRIMQMIASYGVMHADAAQFLAEGLPVGTAATYSFEDYAKGQRDLARIMKVPGLILVLNASEEVLPDRIAKRIAVGGSSTVTNLEFAKQTWARFASPEGEDVYKIEAGGGMQDTIEQAFAAIERFRRI